MPIPELETMTLPPLTVGGTPIGFTAKEDSAQFSEEKVNPAIRKEFEGGFVVTRPRYTRAPVRKITTGYTGISETDYRILKAFWDRKRGGSVSFTYTHPTSGETLTVRFAETLKASYAGMGLTRLWDVHGITLETV